eukprot:1051243-Pyramimonas_sp.AAC.1
MCAKLLIASDVVHEVWHKIWGPVRHKPQSARMRRPRGKDARTLEGHADTARAGPGQRRRPRMGP